MVPTSQGRGRAEEQRRRDGAAPRLWPRERRRHERTYRALVGMVLGTLFPASPGEFKTNQLSFMLGMAAPLEVAGNEALAGARNVANLPRLNAQLASEAQLAELQAGKGIPMAGAGAKAPIKDIDRLVRTYGGDAADWAKVRSSHYKGGGHSFETHAYANVNTGDVVEPKVKLSP